MSWCLISVDHTSPTNSSNNTLMKSVKRDPGSDGLEVLLDQSAEYIRTDLYPTLLIISTVTHKAETKGSKGVT